MSPEPTLPMVLSLGGFLFVILFFTGWYLILDRRKDARRRAAEREGAADVTPDDSEVAAPSVELRVTGAEALVLFEWLASANEKDALVVDEAERRVLWDLEAQLETKLVEPFLPEYQQLVDAAKKRILGVSGAEGE